MLSALSVRNIVLIDQLDFGLDAGLTVLTGETGAGKSILLDALTLALGGRGDASLVRKGAESGQVVAVLQLPADHPARAILRENAIEDDDETILRRVQFADGRTRASSTTSRFLRRCCRRSARSSSKSTASTTTAPSSTWRRTARCSMPSAATTMRRA
jgi:DNA repair ATPase RecN